MDETSVTPANVSKIRARHHPPVVTGSEVLVLPAGHPARRDVTQVLWACTASAIVFTLFAYLTTQVETVRAGSPWQNDPYDGVVSFTEFLVPALTVLIGARAVLLRGGSPQPLFRLHQLLRSALVSLVLAGGTLATDWLAVAARADHRLWNDGTPWLIAALPPLTVMVGAGLFMRRRARRRLPLRPRPADDRADDRAHDRADDWLDDLTPLIVLVTPHVPRLARSAVAWCGRPATIRFLRARITALAVVAAFTAALLITSAQAVGEHWSSPLLFLTGVAVGTGGFTAAAMIINAVLQIAVPTRAPASRRRHVERRAARRAAVAGLLALPASAVLRDGIWAVLGLDGQVTNAREFAAVTFAGAALVSVLVFGASLLSGRFASRHVRSG